jgi:hypothetical protein
VAIAINPSNTLQVIAGAGLANAYSSSNGGKSWVHDTAICGAFNLYGDPFVLWASDGKAVFSDLAYPDPQVVSDGSWIDRIIVNRSNDGGKSYNSCEDFGKNDSKVQFRHSLCVNQQTKTLHAVWTQFDHFESKDASQKTVVRHCYSKDGGQKWSEPKNISAFSGNCANNDSSLLAANVFSGPNGEVYATWAGPKGLMFQVSKDNGNTWLNEEKVIWPFKYGWHYEIEGLRKANGLPTGACDLSKSERRGRIYVCWSDSKNGKDNKDVFMIFSDDKGEHWSEPILITYYPNHKDQFMPCMNIDQVNGDVYVLYYNRQNYAEGGLTDVYLSVSRNGGLKYDHYRLNEKPFRFSGHGSYGDYLGISAVGGEARPIWMEHEGKKLNVYSAIVNDTVLAKYNREHSVNLLEIERNFAFKDEIKLNFKTLQKMDISVVITKPLEPGFEKVIVKNKTFEAGNNSLLIKTGKLGLKKESYIVTLYYNNNTSYAWIIAE